MDQFVVDRIGKPLVMFALAFFCIRYITGSNWDALALGVIPLLLGAINIMTSLSYTFTAIALIVAAGWSVTPNSAKQVIHAYTIQLIQSVVSSPEPDRPGGAGH